MMINFAIIVVISGIITAALRYIIKAKKNGVKCIGCPQGGCANKEHAGCCNAKMP